MPLSICPLSECGDQTAIYIEKLAAWHHEQWLYLNHGALLEERLNRYQDSLISPELPNLYIAHNGKDLLGSVTLDKEDMDSRPFLTPWLASLFVKPSVRQQGIASDLINYCCQHAKQLGYKNVYLFTEDQTQFYQQRGFRLLETVEYRQVEVDLMCHHLK